MRADESAQSIRCPDRESRRCFPCCDGARRRSTLLSSTKPSWTTRRPRPWSRTAARSEPLVVLRSVTKFYGMPALRVGYAVSSPRVAARIAAQLPPWPVTTLAASAAVEASRITSTHGARWCGWRPAPMVVAGAGRRRASRSTRPPRNFLLLRLPAAAPTSARVRARLIHRSWRRRPGLPIV